MPASGVAQQRITRFNATGTHRTNTPAELETILGPSLANRFRIVQNESERKGVHRHLGTTRGRNRVLVLGEFLDQDIRIATGFLEPHFFAGYSGGGKAVLPGLAHLDTVLYNHRAQHMDHVDATWNRTDGNPL